MRVQAFCIVVALMTVCALVIPHFAASADGKTDDPAKTASKAESSATAPQLLGGPLGEQMNAVMKGFDNDMSSVNSGGVLSLPGMGMPSMSLGGAEGALSSGGGMAAPSMDGFPPFFGDNGAPQNVAPQGPAGGAYPLVGTWSAPNGQYVLTMVFRPDGVCALIDKGQQVNGTYEVQGNQLHMRFANGQNISLSFSIEGNFLVLSDGSRLQRQAEGQAQAGQPSVTPQTSLPQTRGTQGLEGAWAVSNGQVSIIMMFMNGVCGFNVNGRQFYGLYTVQGNHLHVQFTNAKPLDVDFTVEGDTLRLSDGTVLRRQQMPNIPGGNQPMPQQQPGVWGQQQPVSQPMPQQKGGQTPLEGAWGTQLPNGVQLVFVFTGSQYRVLANGQPTETGFFSLNADRLEYTTTSGPQMGQKGVNRWRVNGDVLIMTLPNGTSVQFGRLR